MAISEASRAKPQRRTALRQTTLVHMVYQDILSRLQRDEIAPEDRLLDYQIAESFACTRTPVRQALVRLANEGYLVATTRGFLMPVLTDRDVREIFEVRRLLEPGAAAISLESLDTIELDALGEHVDRALASSASQDFRALGQATAAFRAVWIDAIENQRLRSTLARFDDHGRQVRRETLMMPGALERVCAGLKLQLDAFHRRDPQQLRVATLQYIDDAAQIYFARRTSPASGVDNV